MRPYRYERFGGKPRLLWNTCALRFGTWFLMAGSTCLLTEVRWPGWGWLVGLVISVLNIVGWVIPAYVRD